MKAFGRNAYMIFAGAMLALFACLNMHLSGGDYDAYLSPAFEAGEVSENDFPYDDILCGLSQRSLSNVFFETRRPFRQVSCRLHRGSSVLGASGRDVAALERTSRFFKKKFFNGNGDGVYPSPLVILYPKDYYVFTLKRILC